MKKFFTKIRRIINNGLLSFWRNGFVSLSSVSVMSVTLLVIASVLFADILLSTTLQEISNRVDVNVYFVTSAKEDQIFALKKNLEALPEVEKVTYVNREEAIAKFKEKHTGNQLILQALEELKDNPLGATLTIQTKETSQYESVSRFLGNDQALGKDTAAIIDKVNYNENKGAIERLTAFTNGVKTAGFALSIVLIAISVLITFNTIRLAIFTAREEIAVMRLVGASAFTTRGPFVINAILAGVIAAIVALVLLVPITYWLGPITEAFFVGLNVFNYYIQHFGEFLGILLVSGAAIGAISSFIAVKKYLRV